MTDIQMNASIRLRAFGQNLDRLFDDTFSGDRDGFDRTTLFGWKPVSKIFKDYRSRLNGWGGLTPLRVPSEVPHNDTSVSIEETPASILITIDLPRLVRASVRAEVRGNILTLTGDRRLAFPRPEPKNAHEHLRRFQRAFTLPRTVRRDGVSVRLQGHAVCIDIAKY
jgi:HSP20 family molecular chaperone IbpA